jgi:poly(A) polymerase
MNDFKYILENIPLVAEFKKFLAGRSCCYLVGGAVRDALLGRPVHDVDFAMDQDPTFLARSWAQYLGAPWFWLDEARRQSRVLFMTSERELTFDFAPFRAENLEGDLLGRDFTVNALAVEVQQGEMFDPLGGLNDLKSRVLKACADNSYLDDALRVLRAARFIAVLDLQPESHTRNLAGQAAPHLKKVAGERLKAELYHLFEAPEPWRGLDFLADCGALPELFGPGSHPAERHELVQNAKDFSQLLERCVTNWRLDDLLVQPVEVGLSRKGLLRMGAFLHAYSPVRPCQEFTQRLTLSRAAAGRLQSLLAYDPKAIDLPAKPLKTSRQRALWAAKLGSDPVDILLFSGAKDIIDFPKGAGIVEVIQSWQSIQFNGRIPTLINGDWIRRELNISEGLRIGQALKQLSELELRGEVATLEDAQKFLKSLLEKER